MLSLLLLLLLWMLNVLRLIRRADSANQAGLQLVGLMAHAPASAAAVSGTGVQPGSEAAFWTPEQEHFMSLALSQVTQAALSAAAAAAAAAPAWISYQCLMQLIHNDRRGQHCVTVKFLLGESLRKAELINALPALPWVQGLMEHE